MVPGAILKVAHPGCARGENIFYMQIDMYSGFCVQNVRRAFLTSRMLQSQQSGEENDSNDSNDSNDLQMCHNWTGNNYRFTK